MASNQSDQFLWIGASGASWQTASDWNDVTTATSPSPVVPGAGSTTEIDGPLTVAGTGVTGTLTVGNSVTLTGPLTAQTISLKSGAMLTLEAASITAALAVADPNETVEALGAGGTLTVSAPLTLMGRLNASANGKITTQNVTLAGGTLYTGLDGGIGIGGTAGGSDIVVATGAVLSGTGTTSDGYIVSSGSGTMSLSLYGALVVNGTLLSSGIDNLGYLSGTGTIEVAPGGFFASQNALQSATLHVQVDAGATLILPASTVGSSNSIDLAGPGTSLVFDTSYGAGFENPVVSQTGINAVISGLAQGDHFVFGLDDPGGTASATLSGNQLTLLGVSGQTVGTLGFATAPAGLTVLLTPSSLGFGGLDYNQHYYEEGYTQVDAVESAIFGLGAGGDATWNAAASGAWGDGANWNTGVAPGANATATIAGVKGQNVYTVINQSGAASTLAVSGNVALHGSFSAQTVLVAAGANLQASVDTVLTAATVTANGTVTAFGNGATGTGGVLNVTDTLDLEGGQLDAEYAGRASIRRLVLGGGAVQVNAQMLVPTANGAGAMNATNGSAITVGSGNDAAAGAVRVDADGVIDSQHGGTTIQAAVQDDGLIQTAGTLVLDGVLTGAGVLEAQTGGTLTLEGGGLAPTSSLTVRIDAGGTATVQGGSFPAGDTFAFSGPGGILTLSETGTAPSPFLLSPVSGFAYGDEINLGRIGLSKPLATLAYQSTGTNTGNLLLQAADGSTVGSLALLGSFQSSQFLLEPSTGSILFAESGNFPISPGTANGDQFTFIGPNGASLGDPANWTDTTTGLPALVAPGLRDTATFTTAPLVTGAADIGTVTLAGTNPIIDGTLSAGTIGLSGGLTINGTVSAGSIASPSFTDAQVTVNPSGTLVTGDFTFNSLVFAAFEDGLVASGHNAAIDITGTLSDAFSVQEAPIGVQAYGGGTVSVANIGSGTFGFSAVSGGTLILPGGVAAQDSVTLLDGGNTLSVGSTAASTVRLPSLNGMAIGDTLDITTADPVASVTFVPTSLTAGTLRYFNAGGAALGSTALTNTSADADFTLTPMGGNTAAITEIPASPKTLTVGSMVTSSGVVLRTGDVLIVAAGGTASATTVLAGGSAVVAAGGFTDATVVQSGGVEIVSGGTANLSVIGSGGSQTVLAGGSSLSATVSGVEGVLSGGTALGTVTQAGGVELVGVQGSASGAVVSIGGVLLASGGLASFSTVSFGGNASAVAGGVLDHTTVLAHAGLVVSSGGTATNTAVGANGHLTVAAGGTDIGASIAARGSDEIMSGGLAGNTIVSSGGTLTLDPGGTLGAGLVLEPGGAITAGALVSGLVLSGGRLTLTSGASSLSTTLLSGATETVSAGAVAFNTTVTSGATQTIGYSGGAASGTVVSSGGSESVANNSNDQMLTLLNGAMLDVVNLPDYSTGFASVDGNDVLTINENGRVYTEQLAGNYAGFHFTAVTDTPGFMNQNGVGTLVTAVACYCRDTLILADRGEVPVQDLVIGDRLVTISGAVRPIRWIGRRSYAGRFLVGRRHLLPILFRAGALGGGLPRRDLRVSPMHAMFLSGVLVPARDLIDDHRIVQDAQCRAVEYFHVELDTHDVIFAEGAASETFLDDDSRGLFHNASEFAALYPDAPPPRGSFAVRVTDGYELDAITRGLADGSKMTAGAVGG